MKILNFFLKKKLIKSKKNENQNFELDQYYEIGKLVRDARKKNNLSIKELSNLSKIQQSTINAIEQNIKEHRPEYPFLRSILLKLEKCLYLKKYSLLDLISRDSNTLKKTKKEFIIRKIDLINSWKGSVLYFLLLIITLFLINRYFISNIKIIEIQIIENSLNKE